MRYFVLLTVLGTLAIEAQVDTPQGGEGPATTHAPRLPFPTSPPMKAPPIGKTKKGKNNSKDQDDFVKFKGRISQLEDSHFVILTDDKRNVIFDVLKETKFFDGEQKITLKDLQLGQLVDVDSNETEQEDYQAVNVRLLPGPSSVVEKAPEPAADDADAQARPKLKYGKPEQEASAEPDDGEAPKLKYGKPAPGKATVVASVEKPSEEEEAPPVRKAEPPPSNQPDPHEVFLDQAREIASEFTTTLPNFTVLELVTRYASDNHAGTLWKPQDVVSTEVIWKDGHEEYGAMTSGGKKLDPTKAGDRSWSTGEFGTVMQSLLWPGAGGVHLQYARATRLGKYSAVMYDFDIDLAHSHWKVQQGGQWIRPAQNGTIWFDKDTKRVLRIEVQAVDLPKEFPADTVELALDYDYVLLGSKKFLVPVHADSLACHRGMNYCTKNAIEFRNYHRFGSESDIKFAEDEAAPALRPDAQKKKK